MQPVQPSDNASSSQADDNDVEMTSYPVRSNSRSAHDNARIQDEDDGMPELLDVSDSDSSSESDRDDGEVEMLALDESRVESMRDLGADNDDDMLPPFEMQPPPSPTPIIGTPPITPSTPQRNSARRVRVEDDEDEDRDRRHPHHRVGRPPAAINDNQWRVHLNQAPSTSGMPATDPSNPSLFMGPLGAQTQGRSRASQGARPQRPANMPVVGNFSITFDLSTGVPVIVSGGRSTSNANAPGPTMPTATNADNNRPPRATTTSQQSGGLAGADNNAPRAASTEGANGGNDNGGVNEDNNNEDGDPPSPDTPSGPTIFDMLARLGFLTMLGLNPMEREQDDPERAQRLIDGLEEVPVGLVKRMERVGGGGDDGTGDSICAVCWDKLIDEDAESGDVEQRWGKAESSAFAEHGEADRQTGEEPVMPDDTISPSSSSNSSSSLSNSDSSSSALSLEESATPSSSSSSLATTATPSSDKSQTESQTEPEDEPSKKYPKIISLPCAHVFHAACLIPWFSRPRQTTCPSCRFNVDPEELTRRRPNLGARAGPAGLGGPGPGGSAGIFGFGFAPGMGPTIGGTRPADEGGNAAADTGATGPGAQEQGHGHGPGAGPGPGQGQGQGQQGPGGRRPFMMGMGSLDSDVIGIGGISIGGTNDMPMFRFGPFGMDGGNGADNPADGAQPVPEAGEGDDAAARESDRIEAFLQAMFGAMQPPPGGGANGANDVNQSRQTQTGQEQPSATHVNAPGTSPRNEQVPSQSQAGSSPGPAHGVNVNIPASGHLPGINAPSNPTTNGNATGTNRPRAPSRANSFGYLTLGFDVLVTPGPGDPLGAGPGPGLGFAAGDHDVTMEDSFRALEELFNARPPSRQQSRGTTQPTPAPPPTTHFAVPTPPPPPPQPQPQVQPQPQPQPQTQEQGQGPGQSQNQSRRGRFGPLNLGPGIHVRSGVGRSIGEALGQLFANLTGSPPSPSRGNAPSTPAPQQQQQASPPPPPSPFSRMRRASQSRAAGVSPAPAPPPSMFAPMQAGASGQSDSAGTSSQGPPVHSDDHAPQPQRQPQGPNSTQTTLPPFSEILESVQGAGPFPRVNNAGAGVGRGATFAVPLGAGGGHRGGRFSMGTSSVGLGNFGGGLAGAFGAPIIFGLGGPSRGMGTSQPTNARSAAAGAQGPSANLGTAEGPLPPPPPPSDGAIPANANGNGGNQQQGPGQALPEGMPPGFDQLLASLFMPPGAGRTTAARGPTGGRRRPATAPSDSDRERSRGRERTRVEREKKEWTPPPAPGLSLRQRVEKREREAGLRCHDMSCGIGPSDEDPLVEITGDAMKQLDIRRQESESQAGDGMMEAVCSHTFHPACLVSAQRVLLRGAEPCVVGDGVEVSCSVCRAAGKVSKEEWEQGVHSL